MDDTTSTSTTPGSATEIDEARAVAAGARDRLRLLEAEQAQHEAERERAIAEAAEAFELDRSNNYARDFGGRIAAAWETFVDAVRTASDPAGAWVAYRLDHEAVRHEQAEIHRRRDERDDARKRPLRKELAWINEEAGYLLTTPKGDRDSGWRERRSVWNQRLAAFRGATTYDADAAPHEVPGDTALTYSTERPLQRGRLSPEERTFSECIATALNTILAEHTRALTDRRAADRHRWLVDQGLA